MGISTPSTQFVVELADTFKVSCDYILGVNKTATLCLDGLSEDDMRLLCTIAEHLRNRD